MKKRLTAIVVGSCLLALGGVTVWWLSRVPAASQATDFPRTETEVAERAKRTKDPRAGYVLGLSRERGAESTQKLIEAYGEWAGDDSAVEARKLILGTLLAERSLGRKLETVLEAVAGDDTAPEADPIWTDLVENLAALWKPDRLSQARDLMLSEKRPRARRLLIESMARLTEPDRIGELGEQQRLDLASDFIDLFATSSPEEKRELERAIRPLGGDFMADLISGRASDSNLMEVAAQRQREMKESMRELGLDPDRIDLSKPPTADSETKVRESKL